MTDVAKGLGYQDAETLQDKAHAADLSDYMTLTHNAVGLATWFRRFAQAELQPEEG